MFSSPSAVRDALHSVHYLADEETAGAVHLADALGKPLLVEGPAGTGKTQLAKSVAEALGRRLVRLQCYEGLDESRALYEWNYRKQLLHITAGDGLDDLFSEEFLLERPLLAAIRSPDPVVLLVDEVDRLDIETEALLLEVLSEYQVSIPELGTVRAVTRPLIFLTSNNFRELSEALKRRCLYLHLGYPTIERETEIVRAKVPALADDVALQAAQTVAALRTLELKKAPSVAETLDWARSLELSGTARIAADQLNAALPILLKHQSDIMTAREHGALES